MNLDKNHIHYDGLAEGQQVDLAQCVLKYALDQYGGIPTGVNLGHLIWLAHELLKAEKYEFGTIEIVPDIHYHYVITANLEEFKVEAEMFEKILNHLMVMDNTEYAQARNEAMDGMLP
jgi:hypothetical protein